MRFALLAMLLTSSAFAQERVTLFNGTDLKGWVAEGASDYKVGDETKQVWTVNKEGHIFCDGKGFGFLRYDAQKFADFTFHVEFKLQPKCNSGLGFRTPVFDPKRSTATRPSFASYEIQIIDDAGKPANKHSTGSLYRYVAPNVNAHKPAGEWNTMEITCKGPNVTIVFNGEKIIDIDQSKIPELKDKPRDGFVCLQNHGGKIEFKNLWVQVTK